MTTTFDKGGPYVVASRRHVLGLGGHRCSELSWRRPEVAKVANESSRGSGSILAYLSGPAWSYWLIGLK